MCRPLLVTFLLLNRPLARAPWVSRNREEQSSLVILQRRIRRAALSAARAHAIFSCLTKQGGKPMAATIHVMPPALQNQIAAGEVVERPASVVKELVENSLDAGSTRVLVEFKEGGRLQLRVVDNGSGMNAEDALLALERHATSKLSSVEDLRHIHTFGFRGEALPSIASVSRFTLRTRRSDSDGGTEIVVQGGEQPSVRDVGMAPGTEILVEDLFFNVPARRKFLKKESTETQHIVDVMQRMALSHPEVHFKVVSDGRVVLSAPAEADLMARIYSLGPKMCEYLYECFIDGPVVVRGYISEPSFKKRDTSSLFTFVNGRFVRDKLIIQAIKRGYGTLLGSGEYPYVIIDINVPTSEVDVNVHPMKSEVRFLRSGEVFTSITRAVQLTLADNPHVARQIESSLVVPDASPGSDGFHGSGVDSRTGWLGRSSSRPASLPGFSLGPPYPFPRGSAATDQPSLPHRQDVGLSDAGRLSDMRYLGQFFGTYLLGQLGNRLVVIDQHAAHERILFEQLRGQFTQAKVSSQPLLIPILLELDAAMVAKVESRRDLLERLGFHVESFGGSTVAVKGVPALLKQRSPAQPLLAVLETLDEDEHLDTVALFHKPISTMACHSAIRAGDPIEPDEVKALLRQMDEVDLAAFCPHGRPAVVFVDSEQVGRWFHRT